MKLVLRMPNFNKDAKAWRLGINQAVYAAQSKHGIEYSLEDKFDVRVVFYLKNPKLTILDLDNRLKQVFDALQGFLGDKGKRRLIPGIIPNDSQIYRVVAEKRIVPKSGPDTESIIEIRRYSEHKGTASYPRSAAKKSGQK